MLMKMTELEQTTKKKTYYDVNNVGALGGVKRFANEVKAGKISPGDWLRSQPAYSLHKPLRKKFPTRKYQTSGLNDLWQMDLIEMIPYAKINKGYKYILTCIDVFSRFARALPVKSKNASDVSSAIGKMFKHVIPRSVQTDLGKEFYNKNVKMLFKKHSINHYTVHSQFKAALVERFNRTLREKLNRLFTYKGNKMWYLILNNIIDTYNKSPHRGIFNMKPADLTNETEHELWKMQQPQKKKSPLKNPLKLLHYVRISRTANGPFIKNFDQNWSEEVFRIVGIDTKSLPIMYIIEDANHNVIGGKFYREELQDIGDVAPEIYRIEKILRTKGVGEHKQYFVKWYGYDKSHNSWINAKNVER
jgi:hypothetical protein